MRFRCKHEYKKSLFGKNGGRCEEYTMGELSYCRWHQLSHADSIIKGKIINTVAIIISFLCAINFFTLFSQFIFLFFDRLTGNITYELLLILLYIIFFDFSSGLFYFSLSIVLAKLSDDILWAKTLAISLLCAIASLIVLLILLTFNPLIGMSLLRDMGLVISTYPLLNTIVYSFILILFIVMFLNDILFIRSDWFIKIIVFCFFSIIIAQISISFFEGTFGYIFMIIVLAIAYLIDKKYRFIEKVFIDPLRIQAK